MVKEKHLSNRALNVIEELFNTNLYEQPVLNKYNVSKHLYNKWLLDETFVEQLDKQIAIAYHRSSVFIARSAPFAAIRLVLLTLSDNPETAHKACMDIFSMRPSDLNSNILRHNQSFASPHARPYTVSVQGRTPRSTKSTRHSLKEGPVVRQTKNDASTDDEPSRLSAETAGRLLAVLAENKTGQQ
jgi:hypothetical protein